MANKHSPKKGSADFGTAEHYYFEIEPMKYFLYHRRSVIGAQVVKAQTLGQAEKEVEHITDRYSGLIEVARSEYLVYLAHGERDDTN